MDPGGRRTSRPVGTTALDCSSGLCPRSSVPAVPTFPEKRVDRAGEEGRDPVSGPSWVRLATQGGALGMLALFCIIYAEFHLCGSWPCSPASVIWACSSIFFFTGCRLRPRVS